MEMFPRRKWEDQSWNLRDNLKDRLKNKLWRLELKEQRVMRETPKELASQKSRKGTFENRKTRSCDRG